MATIGTRGTDGFLRSRREGGTMENGFSQELRGTSSDQSWKEALDLCMEKEE